MTVRDAEQLEATWRDPPGFFGWFCAINHKTIAKRFMITTFVFFVLAGILALIIRLQLAQPNGRVVGPDLTHLAGRRTIAAGMFPNNRGHLAGWIADPQSLKPGVNMPSNALEPGDLQSLLAYLETLK